MKKSWIEHNRETPLISRRNFLKTAAAGAGYVLSKRSRLEAGVQTFNKQEMINTGNELLSKPTDDLIKENVSPIKRYVFQIEQSGVQEDAELKELKLKLIEKELSILARRLDNSIAIAKTTYRPMDAPAITQDYNSLIQSNAYANLDHPDSPVKTLLTVVEKNLPSRPVILNQAQSIALLYDKLQPKFEKLVKDLVEGFMSPKQVKGYIKEKTIELMNQKGITDPSLQARYVALFLKIAEVESIGFNTMAVSPSGATGIFQFVRTTFIETVAEMNERGVNKFTHIVVPNDINDERYNKESADAGKKLQDPRHHAAFNIEVALYLFEQGRFWHWFESYKSERNWKSEASAVGMGGQYLWSKTKWRYPH